MSNDEIFYQSDGRQVTHSSDILEVSETDGLECTWSGRLIFPSNSAELSWKFNWEGIKTQGITRIHGQITVYIHILGHGMRTTTVDVDSNKAVEYKATVPLMHGFTSKTIQFQYTLVLEPDYTEMFSGLDGRSDRVLLVEGKELHVNKEVGSKRYILVGRRDRKKLSANKMLSLI
uniref:IG domain-containing protein n=1 Tax=Caenorhabditis tropicalis TaxID=1561998 RepID=A0A1I7ULK8_9PELO